MERMNAMFLFFCLLLYSDFSVMFFLSLPILYDRLYMYKVNLSATD